MKTIRAVVDHELTWSQKSVFKNEFELRFGGDLIATLQFPKMIGTKGSAESGDGNWTFERRGFWKTTTVITANEESAPLGSYTSKAWGPGGILDLATGKKYVFWSSFWKGLSEFRTEEGETLFQIEQKSALRVMATVRINRRALSIPELNWMVLFALYLLAMARNDSARAAGAG